MPQSPEDFDEEIRAHLAHEADQLRAEGMASDEAAFAAKRRFGNVTRVREQRYFSTRSAWLASLRSDVQFALRVLLRSPWMGFVAVMVLGIGIGSTVTLYSAIAGVVLRPLPFAEPQRLAVLGVTSESQHTRAGASVPDFGDWRAMTHSFSGLAGYRTWGFEIESTTLPDRVVGARVTANLFSLLGVRALQGRVFAADEDRAGAERVVVLSDSLWIHAYGASPTMVGSAVRLNGTAYTVVGIVDGGAMYPEASLWVPYTFAPYEIAQRGDRAVNVIARLAPNVTVAQARADLGAAVTELGRRFPQADRDWQPFVEPLHDVLIGNSREALAILFIATLSLLVVACANLANGMLARLLARRHELALRSAIGASRGRLVRQLVTESAVLVVAGGVVGLLVALAGTQWLAGLGPDYLPRSAEVRLDLRALLAALALVGLTTAALSAFIGAMTARLELGTAMKSRASAAGSRVSVRDAFVVAQLAIALVLMIDGSLLAASVRRMLAVPLGFQSEGVISATVSLPSGRYGDGVQRRSFFDAVMRSAAALPGVESVAITSRVPFAASATGGVMSTIQPGGEGVRSAADAPRAGVTVVSAGYFQTLGVHLVQGRAFAAGDGSDASQVVIVDETLARRLGGVARAVGMRVRMSGDNGGDTLPREIIGVAASVRMASVTEPPEPMIYVPYSQSSWPSMAVLVRARSRDLPSLIPSLRAAVAAIDPARPIYNLHPLDVGVSRALATRRLQALLLVGFAVSSLVLALLGVYSILTFSVKQRDREFGIRMAVGATRQQVIGGVLREAFARIAAGVGIGLALAVGAGMALRAQLFGVTPWNVPTLAGAAALLLVVGALTSYLPARRASLADPMTALRAD